MHKDYENIKISLMNIFKGKFNMDLSGYSADALNKSLLGSMFGMMSAYLLYLFFDIEKEFGITIPEEDIVAGKFSTFNNIVEIITSQLEKKGKEAV